MAELHGEIQRSRVFLDRCAQVLQMNGIIYYQAKTGTIYVGDHRLSDHSSSDVCGNVEAWTWDQIIDCIDSLPLKHTILDQLKAEVDLAKLRLNIATKRSKNIREKHYKNRHLAIQFAELFFMNDYKKHPELCAKGGEVKHNCARKAQIILADQGCKLPLATLRNLVESARRS